MIDCKTDLLKLFDEPCRGVRKKIKITYVARYTFDTSYRRYAPGTTLPSSYDFRLRDTSAMDFSLAKETVLLLHVSRKRMLPLAD